MAFLRPSEGLLLLLLRCVGCCCSGGGGGRWREGREGRGGRGRWEGNCAEAAVWEAWSGLEEEEDKVLFLCGEGEAFLEVVVRAMKEAGSKDAGDVLRSHLCVGNKLVCGEVCDEVGDIGDGCKGVGGELPEDAFCYVLRRLCGNSLLVEPRWDECLRQHPHPRLQHRRADGDFLRQHKCPRIDLCPRSSLVRKLWVQAEDALCPLGAHCQQTLYEEHHHLRHHQFRLTCLLLLHLLLQRHPKVLLLVPSSSSS